MTEYKSMLCIGGPLDGQRYAAQSGAGFTVPVRIIETRMVDPNSADYRPSKPVPVEFIDYRSDVFHTPQGDVFFWVPKNQTPLETITALLEGYAEAKPAIAPTICQPESARGLVPQGAVAGGVRGKDQERNEPTLCLRPLAT